MRLIILEEKRPKHVRLGDPARVIVEARCVDMRRRQQGLRRELDVSGMGHGSGI